MVSVVAVEEDLEEVVVVIDSLTYVRIQHFRINKELNVNK